MTTLGEKYVTASVHPGDEGFILSIHVGPTHVTLPFSTIEMFYPVKDARWFTHGEIFRNETFNHDFPDRSVAPYVTKLITRDSSGNVSKQISIRRWMGVQATLQISSSLEDTTEIYLKDEDATLLKDKLEQNVMYEIPGKLQTSPTPRLVEMPNTIQWIPMRRMYYENK